jgi:hypothetical protein
MAVHTIGMRILLYIIGKREEGRRDREKHNTSRK